MIGTEKTLGKFFLYRISLLLAVIIFFWSSYDASLILKKVAFISAFFILLDVGIDFVILYLLSDKALNEYLKNKNKIAFFFDTVIVLGCLGILLFQDTRLFFFLVIGFPSILLVIFLFFKVFTFFKFR